MDDNAEWDEIGPEAKLMEVESQALEASDLGLVGPEVVNPLLHVVGPEVVNPLMHIDGPEASFQAQEPVGPGRSFGSPQAELPQVPNPRRPLPHPESGMPWERGVQWREVTHKGVAVDKTVIEVHAGSSLEQRRPVQLLSAEQVDKARAAMQEKYNSYE